MHSFLNLMIVLIPMLLICAEFARVSVVDLSMAPRGVSPDSTQVQRPPEERRDSLLLTLLVTDSTVTVAGRTGFLPTIRYTERRIDGLDEVEPVGLDSVLAQIRQRHAAVADRDAVTIASQSTVVYDKIVKLMDIARHAGFLDISIARLRPEA
jgi:hypothetical protein